MTMLRDEMSGKNDPYKKPIDPWNEQPGQYSTLPQLMSGQEWYDRFEDEIMRESETRAVDASSVVFKQMLQAAKRASELTDKENTQ